MYIISRICDRHFLINDNTISIYDEPVNFCLSISNHTQQPTQRLPSTHIHTHTRTLDSNGASSHARLPAQYLSDQIIWTIQLVEFWFVMIDGDPINILLAHMLHARHSHIVFIEVHYFPFVNKIDGQNGLRLQNLHHGTIPYNCICVPELLFCHNSAGWDRQKQCFDQFSARGSG